VYWVHNALALFVSAFWLGALAGRSKIWSVALLAVGSTSFDSLFHCFSLMVIHLSQQMGITIKDGLPSVKSSGKGCQSW
jgi:hypothetical protein